MTKEQLLAMGFSEEQATNILKLHKETIDGNFVAKHRFDEVNGELKAAKEQVTERDTQIKDLKKFEGDAKALQETIIKLEADNAAKDADYKANLSLERKKNSIKLALLDDENGKPHDADMVMGLFNVDNITIDEVTGKIVSGFKEQNETIRKEKSFLFSEKTTTTPPPGTNPTGWKPAGINPPDGSDPAKDTDVSIGYGKSLAQIKLGMMGVQPKAEE